MTHDLTAYCGIDCQECPAYVAKRNDDNYLREKTAKEWSSDEWSVKPEELNCDGCKSDGELFRHCSVCEVRSCASGKRVQTCAHCDGYICDKLESLMTILGAEAKTRLESMRPVR
ncbi:MAG: DUF3795 domain-containing protein [Candidatus Lokiarchaeota archaeon]|nr:DUF3795 domain-containing protein [Candidatus Lokiarchaeota archaeon]